ncbi:hypothetical protein NE237_027372 [Protea cynaroides]|uniref:Uncharacterized protein n=1 Tax=Protea cynaroides TaxID=273540 RepID=A0A9Q0JU56_9MAGN|nr:hypothetical protein NE237_027372 [Protea cynaroides]
MKIIANDKDLMDMFKDHMEVGNEVIHIYSHHMSTKVVGSFQLTFPTVPSQTLYEVASDGDREESDKDYHEDEENQENDDLLVNEDIYDVSEEENMEDDDLYMANVDSEIEDDKRVN